MPVSTLAHVLSGPFKLRRWPPMAAGAGTWLVYSSGAGKMKSIAPGEHMPLKDAVAASGRYFTVAKRGRTQRVEFRALQNNIMAEFKILVSFQLVVTEPTQLCTDYPSDEILSGEACQLVTGTCRTLAFSHWTKETGQLIADLRDLAAASVQPPNSRPSSEHNGRGWGVYITDVDVHPSPRRFHD